MTLEIKKINNKTNTQLLINYLESAISDEMIFNSFIKDINIVDDLDNLIVIEVPTEPVKIILTKNYKNVFEHAIKEILEKDVTIQIVLKDSYKTNDLNEKIFIENKLFASNIIKKYNFDNYVVASFNKKVVDGAMLILKEKGNYSPLFIYSNSGLGKTHLLHAIGNEVIIQKQKVIYMNPDKFTNLVINSIRKDQESVNKLTQNIIDSDYLLFDDIQFLGNRHKTLSVFLNIINECFEKNTQVVIASDKTPDELGGFEDRFITRFSKGLTLEIKKPNLVDLVEILKFKLDTENLNSSNWEEQALFYIARNYSNSVRSIEGAVKRIKFFKTNVQVKKYSYAIIANIFDNLKIDKEELTPQRIISFVSQHYHIHRNEICGKTRKRNVVMARYIAIWLIRKIILLSLVKIGQLFNGRDHSTIITAINKIDVMMKINPTIKLAIKKIESKISQIS